MDRKEIVQEKEDKIITQQCCTANTNIMILACSGCANVGQLSNQAAVELTRQDVLPGRNRGTSERAYPVGKGYS